MGQRSIISIPSVTVFPNFVAAPGLQFFCLQYTRLSFFFLETRLLCMSPGAKRENFLRDRPGAHTAGGATIVCCHAGERFRERKFAENSHAGGCPFY